MRRPTPCVTIERLAEQSYQVEYWQPRKRSPSATATVSISSPPGLAELSAIGLARSWAKLHACDLVTIDDGKIIRG